MHGVSDVRSSGTMEPVFVSIIQILEDRSTSQDDRDAVHFFHDAAGNASTSDCDIWSWKELRDRACHVAAALVSRHGVTPRSRVLLVYPSGLDFLAAFYGCIYAGAVPVPVPPPRRSEGLNRWLHIARDAAISGILTSSDLVESLKPLTDSMEDGFCTALDITDPALRCPSVEFPDFTPFTPGPADIAFLQYTSGSTNDPKGVVITHGNMIANLSQISTGFEMNRADRMVSWLPHYHDMGLIGCILSPVFNGYSVAYISPASFLRRPLRFLALATQFKATIFGGPNFSYEHCVRRSTPEALADLDFSSIRVAFTGAEAIRPETLDRFEETFSPYGFRKSTFLCCYGMAEATLFISGIKPSESPTGLRVRRDILVSSGKAVEAKPDGPFQDKLWLELAGSGRAVQGLDLAIVSPDNCQRCDDEEVGEVWVKGENVSAGYWQRPELNSAHFGLDLDGISGWFRTGDLGFLREGQLFITGRLKDMIVIRGENHYPQDIELTVTTSHPALAEGKAGAVPLDINGEECLGIVCEVKREALRTIDTPVVFDAIRSAISHHHDLQIAAIALIRPGHLPQTPSGKVRRFACRKGLEATTLQLVGRWDAQLVQRPLVEVTDEISVPKWRDNLLQQPVAKREDLLRERLQNELAAFAGLPNGEIPSPDKGFFDLGLDSLAVVNFGIVIERETSVPVSQTLMFEYPTIIALAAHLCSEMFPAKSTAASHPVEPLKQTLSKAKPLDVSEAIAAELAALQALLDADEGHNSHSLTGANQ